MEAIGLFYIIAIYLGIASIIFIPISLGIYYYLSRKNEYGLVPLLISLFILYASWQPYFMKSIIFQLFILLCLVGIIILIKNKKLSTNIFLVVLFIASISAIFGVMIDTHKGITKIALEKFGVEPKYININFDIISDYTTPHATLEKEGKEYIWSFTEKNFVFYYNHHAWERGWKKATPKSIDNMLQEYVFKKEVKEKL